MFSSLRIEYVVDMSLKVSCMFGASETLVWFPHEIQKSRTDVRSK